ncbi:hypothetical protein J2W92_002309 [Rhizobium leguminosarum]
MHDVMSKDCRQVRSKGVVRDEHTQASEGFGEGKKAILSEDIEKIGRKFFAHRLTSRTFTFLVKGVLRRSLEALGMRELSGVANP